MVETPQLLMARVMHKRLLPKIHAFAYQVYYLMLPLPAAPVKGWLASFHARDLGQRDGSDPLPWLRNILEPYGLNTVCTNILLVTMPRVLGYVFNPVSFYLCRDSREDLRAVVCEVHNTFGEQHTYLCANPDHSPITSQQWLEADKVFHVSPFLERTGKYRFRFALHEQRIGIWIDFYDAQQNKQLITALLGDFSPLTEQSLRRAFWRHPLVTLKAITLIHWQAVRLVLKGIRYIALPKQLEPKITATQALKKAPNLNKM
ncbi:MAG: DUF1365 domain-containing protein [Alphaproteobacteria bacterium]|nr:DUF1365 domain-containing protein [Alphaproteobacteria bacterium]